MKYSDVYKEYLENETRSILLNLKEAFVIHYGKKNRSRIENVFKELGIAYYSENFEQGELNDRTQKLNQEYNECIKNLLQEAPNITEEDLINYVKMSRDQKDISNKLRNYMDKLYELSYNKFLQKNKINETSNNIFLGFSRGSLNQTLEKFITDDTDRRTGGFSLPYINHSNFIAVKETQKGKIKLHILAHEINHQLQYEKLAKIQDLYGKEKILLSKDICSKHNDFVDELINDYSAIDVVNIFCKYCYSPLLDLRVGSGYTKLDAFCGNTIKKVYELLRSEIKERLINGNVRTIRNIIDGNGNTNNYRLLNEFYLYVENEYLKQKDFSEEQKAFFRSYTGKIFDSIQYNYNEYKKSEAELRDYVDRMIVEGKVKKL